MITGLGKCAANGVTSNQKFYCAFGQNCNNFASIGFKCFDPSTLKSVGCTSSQWQCATSNTDGKGSCSGLVDTTAFFSCAAGSNCNAISSCLKDGVNTIEYVSCDPKATKACQVNYNYKIGFYAYFLGTCLGFETFEHSPKFFRLD